MVIALYYWGRALSSAIDDVFSILSAITGRGRRTSRGLARPFNSVLQIEPACRSWMLS